MEEDGDGLETSWGQEAVAGQLSENHCIARSKRKTVMLRGEPLRRLPDSSVSKVLASSKARKLTVLSGKRSATAKAVATASKDSVTVMRGHSVITPVKSRRKLPDAKMTSVSNIHSMDLRAILSLIETRLEDLNLSADKASRLAGKPDAIRNIRRAVKRGAGGATAATLAALETALNVEPGTLQRIGTNGAVPVPEIQGGELGQLRYELKVLLDQQAAINAKIQGLQYAISILEARSVRPGKKNR